MDIYKYAVKKVVEKNGTNAKRFITKRDEFLKAFAAEYTVIINQSKRTDMITNPAALKSKINITNIEELQKVITKHLYTELRSNNLITESEYVNLCKGEA